MKIRIIRLRNLNALRGDITIDFETPPLAHAGLFAITGDTGAGKTTILDAITLALFGCTSREHEAEVMSFGTQEALAEVEFDNENGIFLARWQQKRTNRKANPLTITRELAQLQEDQSWTVIAAGAKEVDSTAQRKGAVERFLGLNFDQFKRTVLLAQGEFAAFLLSDEKNRSAVLERLTDTEIYTRLSKAAHQRAGIERQKLDLLLEKRAELKLLDAEQTAELKTRKTTLEDQTQNIAVEVEQLRINRDQLIRRAELDQQHHLIEQQQQTLAAAKEQLIAESILLDLHEAALPFQTDFALLENLRNDIPHQETTIGELANGLQTAKQQAEQLKKTADEHQQTLTAAETTAQHTRDQIERAIRLDDQIRTQALQQTQLQQQSATRQQQISQLTIQLEQKNASLLQIRTELDTSRQWLYENAGLEAGLAAQNDAKLHIERLRGWYKDLLTLSDNRQQLLEQLKSAEQQLDAQQQITTVRTEQQAKLQAAWQQLLHDAAHVVQHDGTHKPFHQHLAALTARRQAMENFLQQTRDYRSTLTEMGELRERQEALRAEARHLLMLLDENEHELAYARHREQLKQQRYELNQLLRERVNLQPGQPCPLCGALDHPWAAHDLDEFDADARLELDRAKHQVDDLKKTRQRLEQQLRELSRDLSNLEADFEETLDWQTSSLIEKASLHEQKIQEIARIAFDNEEEQPTLREEMLIQAIDVARNAEQQAKRWYDRAEQLRNDLQSGALMVLEAEKDLQQALSAVTMIQNAIRGIDERIADIQPQYDREQLTFNDLMAPYQIRFEAAPAFKTAFENWLQQLEAYAAAQQLQTRLLQTIEVTDTEIRALQSQLNERVQEGEPLEAQLRALESEIQQLAQQREALLGKEDPATLREALHLTLSELKQVSDEAQQMALASHQEYLILQEKHAAAVKHLSELQHKLTTRTAALEKRLSKTQFQTLDDLAAAFLDETVYQQIKARRQEINQQATELDARLQAWQTEWTRIRQIELPFDDPAVVQEHLNRQQASLQALQQEIGAITQQLTDQADREKESAALLARIEQQQAAYKRWDDLRSLIGSADGSVLRRFAQGLTLTQLIQYANHHLALLQGGRYRLRKNPDADLEIDMVDTFQADNVRSVRTLSGGETFLTSLALALGLADMTGRKTRIRSLFIDEGFGALDETALDIAVSTLENLQARGTTIGVISHIREMKERLNTQIQVIKNSDGFSKIEIVG